MSVRKTTRSFHGKTKKITLEPGQVVAGKYQIVRSLGVGGMGEVYLAERIGSGQKMAVKCCFNEFYAERFEKEVHCWLALGRHPNVVAALFFERIQEIPSLWMEYVDGPSLKQVIEESRKTKKNMSWKTVLDYAIQLCDGMTHLHEHGVIHRDLKPSNLLISRQESRLKITDMGISKMKGRQALETTHIRSDFLSPEITGTLDVLGTPAYMSPQQYLSSKAVGEETDIYAFGVIFYEMLTQGRKPLEGTDYEGWLYAHTKKAPTPIQTQVPMSLSLFHRKSKKALYDMVMQCLAKESEARPRSFGEIETKLRTIYQELFSETYPKQGELFLSQEEINNQAVSLLEMGDTYTEEGRQKLSELCASSDCLEAQLNHLLFYLKSGRTTLKTFWQKVKEIPKLEKEKMLEVLGGAALERGSFLHLCLKSLSEIEKPSSSLLRLRAKFLYALAQYESALPLYEALCKAPLPLWEDFYHHAGALVHLALQHKKAKLLLNPTGFSLALDEATKAHVFRIFEEGEKAYGVHPAADVARDSAIGLPQEKAEFWHEEKLWQGHDAAITSVSLSADEVYGLSGAENGEVKLWHLPSQQELATLAGHAAPITAVNLSGNGKFAACADRSGKIQFWQLFPQKLLAAYENGSSIEALSMTSDGLWVATGDERGTLHIWDLENLTTQKTFWKWFRGKRVRTWRGKQGAICSLALSEDGNFLLAGTQDQSLLCWDWQKNKIRRFPDGHKGVVRHIALRGTIACTASDAENDSILVWNLPERKKQLSFSGFRKPVSSLTTAQNGRLLFLGYDKSAIVLWDWKKQTKLAFLEGQPQSLSTFAASPKGTALLSAGQDGHLCLWRNTFFWPPLVEQKYWKTTIT